MGDGRPVDGPPLSAADGRTIEQDRAVIAHRLAEMEASDTAWTGQIASYRACIAEFDELIENGGGW